MTKILLLFLTIILLPPAGAAARGRGDRGHAREISVYDCASVDREPEFPGGDCAMIRFIDHERRYPAKAYRAGVEGRVLCSFVVGEDGAISHVAVVRSVEESLDREAVRVISQMPRWDAGRLGGQRVPVLCLLPIAFRR